MRGCELVIFDCDGVLVDSEPISNTVLAEMLSEQGLATTLAQARREYQGLLLSQVLERAQARLGRELPPGWLERYESERTRAFRSGLRAVEGAGEAVRELRLAGVGVCVASQGKLEKTRLSLSLTGLIDLFPEGSLFSAESVARGKPHPDLFLHAVRVMGAPPEGCVVVEDTPSGVRAGVAAGMRVLAYAADGDRAALAAAGGEIVMSMTRIAPLACDA